MPQSPALPAGLRGVNMRIAAPLGGLPRTGTLLAPRTMVIGSAQLRAAGCHSGQNIVFGSGTLFLPGKLGPNSSSAIAGKMPIRDLTLAKTQVRPGVSNVATTTIPLGSLPITLSSMPTNTSGMTLTCTTLPVTSLPLAALQQQQQLQQMIVASTSASNIGSKPGAGNKAAKRSAMSKGMGQDKKHSEKKAEKKSSEKKNIDKKVTKDKKVSSEKKAQEAAETAIKKNSDGKEVDSIVTQLPSSPVSKNTSKETVREEVEAEENKKLETSKDRDKNLSVDAIKADPDTDFSDTLEWQDGIGTLPGSDMKVSLHFFNFAKQTINDNFKSCLIRFSKLKGFFKKIVKP